MTVNSKLNPLQNAEELPEGWCRYKKTLTGYRTNYSIKMSIMSILNTRNNEFWMIWSDLFPIFMFAYLSSMFFRSDHFGYQTHFYQVLTGLVHFAIIISRACSSLYHIFNCTSLSANQKLINFDLMGICQGALGSPYFMARLLRISHPNNDAFRLYIAILSTNYAICMLTFGYLLVSNNKNKLLKSLSITFLLLLAALGNAPLIAIGLDHSFPTKIRAFCLCGPSSLTIGYLIYISNFPEIFFRPGIADGKIWNSHVIWHNFVTIAQIYFMAAT